jgi:hypothetical protein
MSMEIGPPVRVNVKLAPHADRRKLERMLAEVPGVRQVIQTFPGESDEELSSLYMLEIEPDRLQPGLKTLRDNPGIGYVEEAAPRRLIRSTEQR